MAAAALEQEIRRRSVAEAIRPIKDRAVASSSSAAGPVTERMVAEACDTLIRLPHLSGLKTPGLRLGVTKVGRERTKSSTPRPERGGSPTRAEQGPVQAMWSPSPVLRKEKPSALHAHVPETGESGSDGSVEGRREERHHPVAPRSASRSLQPGWNRPPLSGDSGRPRLWPSSWVVRAVSGTATGAVR